RTAARASPSWSPSRSRVRRAGSCTAGARTRRPDGERLARGPHGVDVDLDGLSLAIDLAGELDPVLRPDLQPAPVVVVDLDDQRAAVVLELVALVAQRTDDVADEAHRGVVRQVYRFGRGHGCLAGVRTDEAALLLAGRGHQRGGGEYTREQLLSLHLRAPSPKKRRR